MIRIRGLEKRYGDHVALAGVDLTVPRGSIYGLVGPNGAGKTTLLSILAGLRSATRGEVAIDAPVAQRAVLPDAPRFDPWLKAREVVALAAELSGGATASRVAEVLDLAGLTEAADRASGGFSRGMLQRLGLAATLVADPLVVLLDEPAAALDPAGRREVLDVVDRMRGDATVIFSSHILADVQAVSDRVGILDRGVLRYEGSVGDLLDGVAETAYLVRVRTGEEAVATRLAATPWVNAVTRPAPGLLRVAVRSLAEAETRLVPALAEVGAAIVSVEPQPVTLERAFLELTR